MSGSRRPVELLPEYADVLASEFGVYMGRRVPQWVECGWTDDDIHDRLSRFHTMKGSGPTLRQLRAADAYLAALRPAGVEAGQSGRYGDPPTIEDIMRAYQDDMSKGTLVAPARDSQGKDRRGSMYSVAKRMSMGRTTLYEHRRRLNMKAWPPK
jgi:hypothetical protein